MPSCKSTVLKKKEEKRILESLKQFEIRHDTGIVTTEFTQSLDAMEISSSLPPECLERSGAHFLNSEVMKRKMKQVLEQLYSVRNGGWMRSFFSRNKSNIRQSTRKKALEVHRASNHQVEFDNTFSICIPCRCACTDTDDNC